MPDNIEELNNKIKELTSQLENSRELLIKQERLATLGHLTAGITHEIKNPLNFINNFSELTGELIEEIKENIVTDPSLSDTQKLEEILEILTDIETNCQKISEYGKRANSTINQMLLHSRGSKEEKHPEDINQALLENLSLAYHGMRAHKKDFNVHIVEDLDNSLPDIPIVVSEINRVFLNLINNAFYAIYERQQAGGKGYKPEINISSVNLDNSVEIKIRDNGSGISKDDLKNIFEAFYTTKPIGEGTGLGLSISYDTIVKDHNGKINVNSEEGQFTEFSIILNKN